jgi:hypothetical protein
MRENHLSFLSYLYQRRMGGWVSPSRSFVLLAAPSWPRFRFLDKSHRYAGMRAAPAA